MGGESKSSTSAQREAKRRQDLLWAIVLINRALPADEVNQQLSRRSTRHYRWRSTPDVPALTAIPNLPPIITGYT